MRAKYLGGNYGYGHAKTELLNLILENFKTEREKFNYYLNNLDELDAKLKEGAEKTRKIAAETLKRVRESLRNVICIFTPKQTQIMSAQKTK